MEKNNELSKYSNARILTLFLAIITIIGCSVLITKGQPFSRASILPQIGIAAAFTFSEPLKSILMFLSIVIPVAIYGSCFYFSKKQYKWLMPALILISIDTGSFVAFLAVELSNSIESITSTFIFDLIIEMTFLVYIIKGYRAGKGLNNDFTEVPTDKIIDKDKASKVYSFDKRTAIRNKADKSSWLLLAILITLAFIMLDLYMLSTFASTNTTFAISLFFVVLTIVCILFVFVYIYLKPYIGVRNTYYYLKNDIVTRYINATAPTIESFPGLKLTKDTKNTYICEYDGLKGKKKLVIPKCFPGIEKIIKR